MSIIFNEGQSNLAKGDITLLSYLPGGSTRREVARKRCIFDPHFGRRRGSRGSAMVLFERAMVVSYRLSTVTTALFNRDLPSNVSDAQINSGWVTLVQN